MVVLQSYFEICLGQSEAVTPRKPEPIIPLCNTVVTMMAKTLYILNQSLVFITRLLSMSNIGHFSERFTARYAWYINDAKRLVKRKLHQYSVSTRKKGAIMLNGSSAGDKRNQNLKRARVKLWMLAYGPKESEWNYPAFSSAKIRRVFLYRNHDVQFHSFYADAVQATRDRQG